MPKKNVCYDHLGNQYESFEQMCRTYNKDDSTVNYRLKLGLSLEKALTEEAVKGCRLKRCKDHLGNTFNSFEEMCKTYNKSKYTVSKRLERGMSLKDALTKEVAPKIYKDHLGNEYNSFREMCKAFNKRDILVQYRLKQGWSLEKALTYEVRAHEECYDHLGNQYKSFSEMCRAYGKYSETVKDRLEKGWSLEEALTKRSINSSIPKKM